MNSPMHKFPPASNDKNQKIAYVTQTTLSVFDTEGIVRAIKDKFPNVVEPKKSDICYATSNRQLSVQELAKKVDSFYVIGANNSSHFWSHIRDKR